MFRRRALFRTSAILSDRLCSDMLINLKHLHFLATHILGDVVCLPLLELKTDALMGVILVVGLILVILDLDKVRIDRVWIQRKRDQGIDGDRLRNKSECPCLKRKKISTLC